MPINAFIIRPFGKKKVVLSSAPAGPKEAVLDFDKVEQKLIHPALTRLGISGRTTLEILRAGNIREDMFHRLLTADLVIADLSIHNANVFYELGLRHAFRDKYTLLIRSNSSELPFDLQTDRYFVYDRDKPGASVESLVETLNQTLHSDKEDSPVYKMLPNLKEQDRSRFLAAPREFCEAVERARKAGQSGDLRLLAAEAEGFIWEIEGLREVGRAQMDLNFHWGAKSTWEALQRRFPDDLEANMMLSRIYPRLDSSDPSQNWQAQAELALRRVLSQQELERSRQSEVRALVGRQHKSDWKKTWGKIEDVNERCAKALSSPFLREAYQAYADAFFENLNNYHAGLNALALLLVEIKLAEAQSETWRCLHDFPDEALTKRTAQAFRLTTAVELSLEAEKRRLDRTRNGKRDFWFELNEASFYCITSNQAHRVAKEFEEAFLLSPPSWIEAMREILETYQRLGVFTENVKTALAVLDMVVLKPESTATLSTGKRILLFAGHRLDSPKNAAARTQKQKITPRFPAGEECEARARAAIERAIRDELKQGDEILFGMAAGANGGDILFHEACQAMELKTKLYLAVPSDQYIGDYVSHADRQDKWVERFNTLFRSERTVERVVLSDSSELPRWLKVKHNYDIRRRSKLWLLQHALANRILDGAQLTLIALWDGEDDGTNGGIDELVGRAKENGIKVIHLNTKELFAIRTPASAPQPQPVAPKPLPAAIPAVAVGH